MYRTMAEIIEFIHELEPENKLGKLKAWKVKGNEYMELYLHLKQWKEDGFIIPNEWLDYLKFIVRPSLQSSGRL